MAPVHLATADGSHGLAVRDDRTTLFGSADTCHLTRLNSQRQFTLPRISTVPALCRGLHVTENQ